MPDSFHYYNSNADTYLATTTDVDMSKQYSMFLPYLEKGARILDAGCGSGRDSLAFKRMGYEVEAFDLSESMVKAAQSYAEVPVRWSSFQELDEKERYDGIWACASLLHVPRIELSDVFIRLERALKPSGVLYCSFKNRDLDFESGGRFFTCFTENSFRSFVGELNGFCLSKVAFSNDVRLGREKESWINAVLIKIS